MFHIKITQLSNPGCKKCAKVRETLENEVLPKFEDIKIEHIDLNSDNGQALALQHDVLASPGILVNGTLFSFGSLDAQKLIKTIMSLQSL